MLFSVKENELVGFYFQLIYDFIFIKNNAFEILFFFTLGVAIAVIFYLYVAEKNDDDRYI